MTATRVAVPWLFAVLTLSPWMASTAANLLPAPTSTEGGLSITPTDVDFGRFLVGQTLRRQVSIENTSAQSLRLTKIIVPAGLTVALSKERTLRIPVAEDGSLDVELAAGEKANCNLVLASRGLEAGAWQGTVSLRIAGSETPLQVSCKADLVAATRRPLPIAPDRSGAPAGLLDGPQPHILPAEQEFDLGTLAVGEDSSHIFDFRNDGEAPLAVEGIRVTCKCTGRRLWTDEVEVGEDILSDRQRQGPVLELEVGKVAHVEIHLDTKSMVASPGERPLEKVVHLLSNDPKQPSLPLKLIFRLEQVLRVDPPRLMLPDGRRGEELRGTVRVSSTSGERFSILEVVPPEHSDLAASFRPVTHDADGDYPEGTAYDLDVVVPATSPAGRVNGSFTVLFDHPRVKELQFTAFGQVLSQVDFLTDEEQSRTTLLNFGVMDGSKDETRVLRIVNHDPSVPYVPTNVELQARRGGEFMKHTWREVVPGAEYVIEVTVSKDMNQRYFDAYLRISSEHPDEALRVVPLRGFFEKKTTEEGSGR